MSIRAFSLSVWIASLFAARHLPRRLLSKMWCGYSKAARAGACRASSFRPSRRSFQFRSRRNDANAVKWRQFYADERAAHCARQQWPHLPGAMDSCPQGQQHQIHHDVFQITDPERHTWLNCITATKSAISTCITHDGRTISAGNLSIGALSDGNGFRDHETSAWAPLKGRRRTGIANRLRSIRARWQ